MLKQTFIVTLEIGTPLEKHLPKIEAERMANIIRDGVAAKSCSLVGSIPFTITCQRVDDTASVSGQIQEVPEEEPKEVLPRMVAATDQISAS